MNSPYHQLEESKHHFRLLRLLDCSSEHFQCELRTFSLFDDALPPWKALSYRWGEAESEFVVHLENHPIPIRRNLYKIMTQMITENRRDWIFIDALCIDQDNETEKPGQVQLMGEIYRRAEEVVAWLVYEPSDDEAEETDGPVYDPYDSPSVWRAQLESAVLENSYWSRLWILQEVLLAKRLTIRMGSAEVEWMNLIPEKTIFERKGLPAKNDNLGFQQPGTDPYANKKTALNILRYRRFETKSLRAGHHLPFNKAFDFFAQQRCGRPHDKVFGYLGLTNSRIQVDYSISILDLFVATLADYLLSAGFITQDLKRMNFVRTHMAITNANGLIAPLLAFGLDLDDPVVNLLFHEVAKFFAPGFEETITNCVMSTWWFMRDSRIQDSEFINLITSDDHKFELRYIGNVCIKFVKFVASETRAYMAFHKEFAARQKALAQEDAVISAGGSDVSKKYSEWVAHATAISSQMWGRFQESGEDAEGDMDDESWTLIA